MRLLHVTMVFTDIINNKTEILHWYCRVNLIYMADRRHLIIQMNWLYTWHLIGIWFCADSFYYFYSYFICYFCFIPVYMFHNLLTFICICTFLFILTHSLGVLTPWIYISRSGTIYCWPGIWRGSHAPWGAGVSLFLIISIPALFSCYSLFLSILYPVTFHILSYAIIVLTLYVLFQ